MRHLLSISLLLLTALVAWADDNAKPNTLTPKEIAEGWILLFDGETTFGWGIDGTAKVDGGVLTLGPGTTARLTTRLCDYELEFEYQMAPTATAYFCHYAFFDCRGLVKPDNAAAWNKARFVVQYNEKAQFYRFAEEYTKASGAKTFWGWDTEGGKLSPGKDGFHLIGIKAHAGDRVAIRNLKLKPFGLKSPFYDSKDLSGWKEFPGKKSKFTVTNEGWINIKDGPGDLQTEAQWSDFVLQLDCISNGKHCNSGVFFRCKPGEYQQGYEAQIHNHFAAEPAKEYAIEEYDPKTNALKETKKVKYAAVDYGTGAIYRRIPARKEVAKDGEWFTMTVIAHGRHIATWVNGIQVVDWTDNRPIKDNARNGCRLEKGPISLQGHDPTTDLSFRNIRIAELPAVKLGK